jgi:hypothetical protein
MTVKEGPLDRGAAVFVTCFLGLAMAAVPAQVQTFLQQTDWTPTLGTNENSIAGDRPVTTSLTAGGVNPAAWKNDLGREAPARLFPELRKRAGR